MSDMKPIGWVIVDPKGKALAESASRTRSGAWSAFDDLYAVFDERLHDCLSRKQVYSKARHLGYRAERVYVNGGR